MHGFSKQRNRRAKTLIAVSMIVFVAKSATKPYTQLVFNPLFIAIFT